MGERRTETKNQLEKEEKKKKKIEKTEKQKSLTTMTNMALKKVGGAKRFQKRRFP